MEWSPDSWKHSWMGISSFLLQRMPQVPLSSNLKRSSRQCSQMKMNHYDIFRRHAWMYIEPAIAHSWKTAQDGMLQQNIVVEDED
ncbi:hypothetical protein QQF64_024287 [Cirrhinus molitorella]|uniref:Uncharacterized protein n=1 Tax=Cirrhinus molitorella TaxID=172907 RepID=A0ABR3NL00_9TELE